MEVILLRHGCAEPQAATDKDRALTVVGVHEVHKTVQARADRLAQVDTVWVSPYRRAQQTLEAAWEKVPELRQCSRESLDILTPSSSAQTVINRLYACQDEWRTVLLVSHQPLVGTLLDELCGFEPGQYRLSTGSMAAVRLDVVASGVGVLDWIQYP